MSDTNTDDESTDQSDSDYPDPENIDIVTFHNMEEREKLVQDLRAEIEQDREDREDPAESESTDA